MAVDDGTREKAWDLSVGSEPYRRLPPGTFVHARVNQRSRADVTVEPVEPPAVARPLARVAADHERAATNGLPDPADLVTEAEARTALISIHGAVPIAAEASLAGLLPVVEGWLRELGRGLDFNQY